MTPVNTTFASTTARGYGLFAKTSTYKKTVLDDNPIGFWLLNETSGSTATDSSTSGINATYNNSPTLGLSGTPQGGILKSVGLASASNQNITTTTNATFNVAASANWSMEIWAKWSGASTSIQALMLIQDATGTTSTNTGGLFINNSVAGRIQGYSINDSVGGYFITKDGGYNDDKFHQFVLTSTSGGNLELYVDGVSQASSSTARFNNSVNRRLAVGVNGTNSQPLTATVAAVSFYNTTLSASRILAHYETGK